MINEDKITLSDWNKLTSEEKETLRIWVIAHGDELEIVPGSSGTFDPVCGYAALLTVDQMIIFLQSRDQKVSIKSDEKDNCRLLWEKTIKELRKG